MQAIKIYGTRFQVTVSHVSVNTAGQPHPLKHRIESTNIALRRNLNLQVSMTMRNGVGLRFNCTM
jgi:hypothetical protein